MGDDATSDDEVLAQAAAAAKASVSRDAPTIVVSNEVGAGIVPANALARRYRDLLGRVNATFADEAGTVVLMVAGRAVTLSEPMTTLEDR